ncbi:FAD-dependent oxidoreductase [uncultured Clostridium sp.]|uniref:NAD(P)/FAD-dependent oxidoreductase n=1 Tax=uncultured Clostridium sp. TaxID=59620 RepID=UPI00260B2BB0|nr:FAD-dependent oxidoreductase [uncultured Clostridium sp.]
MKNKIFVDILIIGKNRAAFTSAIYCSRANAKTVILDKYSEQVIEQKEKKSPSFITVAGNKDTESLQIKAEEFGVSVQYFENIEKMILTNDTKIIETDKVSYVAKVVIITLGNEVERFEIPSEEKFREKGIYYNALVNTEKFRGKGVAVIGEGHSCLEEALYLSKVARKVVVIKRVETVDCNKLVLREIEKVNNINIINGYELVDAFGLDELEGIYLKDLVSEKRKRLKIDAIFGSFGKKPNLYDKYVYLEHRDDGYIKVDESMGTNIKGVFAVGAAIEKVFDEIPSDLNDATIASLTALSYLDK